MFEKLEEVQTKFEKLNIQLQDPEVTSNQEQYKNLMKEYSDLEQIVVPFKRYKEVKEEISYNEELLESEKDSEMREMAKEELSSLKKELDTLEQDLKIALIPKDPNDEKNIILEMRPGAGGDEAALFVEELFSAYSHYAKSQSWRVEILSISEGNAGGYKEVTAVISGDKVFSKMKFESGVHRVQRVPKTETQGRVHTSTITVAVLPEAEEVEVNLNMNDVRVDVYRASGAGGQHVNTTDSAVRLTHEPTGIVVSCQDEKSQHKNKEKALKVLYARILDAERSKAEKEASEQRLGQIGTGDRSERIRTYNFPQTRITDHRIGHTIHSLPQVIAGDMAQIIDPVITYFQAEALKAQGAN